MTNRPRRTWIVAPLLLTLLVPTGCDVVERTVHPERADAAAADAGTTASRAPSPTYNTLTDTQRQRLADAQVALDRGASDSAIELFNSILAENPTIAVAYVGLGDAHMSQGRFGDAEPAYARAARLEPRNFDAQYGHGRSLLLLERFVDAVRAFHRALTINPSSVVANLSLATTYLRMDESQSAVVYAEKAAALEPDNGAARANLGASYEKLGRNADAIEEYLVAIELLDDPAPVMLNLVNTLARERRYRETINTAENLIKLRPQPNAYERLGWARFKLGLFQESMEAYRNAVALDATHWPSLNGIGVNALNSWLLSGKTDAEARLESRDAFRQSLRVNTNQPEVLRVMTHYNLR